MTGESRGHFCEIKRRATDAVFSRLSRENGRLRLSMHDGAAFRGLFSSDADSRRRIIPLAN